MLLTKSIGDFAQCPRVDAFELAGDQLDTMHLLHGFAAPCDVAAGDELLFQYAQFFFEFFFAREQPLEPFKRLGIAGTQMAANLLQNPLPAANRFQRTFAGERLDSPNAGRDARLAFELEQADIAGTRDMGSTAEFDREIAHPHNPHTVAVFIAEECQRAGLNRLIVGHLLNRDARVLANPRVDLLFNRCQVACGNRTAMSEVEAQTLRCHQRAGLMHFFADDIAQRIVQNMGRRMVQHRRIAALAVDAQTDTAPALELTGIAAQEASYVKDRAVMFARVSNLDHAAGYGLDHAAVADLAAALGIEWSLGRNDRDPVTISMSGDYFRLRLVAAVEEMR